MKTTIVIILAMICFALFTGSAGRSVLVELFGFVILLGGGLAIIGIIKFVYDQHR